MLEKDHRFWRSFSARLTGDWIAYDTTVEEICEFAERVYLRKDFKGFEGDPRFVRDDNAQKAFSKLRSAIAGVYAWRLGLRGAIQTPPQYRASTPEQEQQLLQETEFAYKQAFAFCPYSPEAVYNYVQMLATHTRFDEALALARTAAKFDPHNMSIVDLIQQLEQFRNQQEVAGQMRTQLPALEQNFRSNPSNVQIGIQLASAYLQVQQNDKAVEVLDQIVDNPAADSNVLLSIAQVYSQLQHPARLERALLRLTAMMPQNPEAWYELALVQTGQGKHSEALEALKKAMETNARRLQSNPAAADLQQDLRTNTEFGDLRAFPGFQELVAP
jgi:tetratricopeptide (TPR) repeat protein